MSCSATPSDGISSGEPVASKSKVTISNSLPSSRAPASAHLWSTHTVNSSATLMGGMTSAGDPEELAYTWIVVGEDSETIIPGQVGATLPRPWLPVKWSAAESRRRTARPWGSRW